MSEPMPAQRPSGAAWLMFAVSFGLLLSDYMSRQVLAAVFPLLKADWGLSDGQLGALGGIVALMVGLLTFPLSLAADRIGRTRSVIAMAVVWSLATAACGLCAAYGQLMAARLVLGVGEAAYGSVGLAVVLSLFPASWRATVTSAFMAGGVFGSFLGMTLGGLLAAEAGWRGAFYAMAAIGILLAAAYALVARRLKAQTAQAGVAAGTHTLFTARGVGHALFGSSSLLAVYAASGAGLFVIGAMTAWAPSYLNREFGLAPASAAAAAAGLLLFCGVGMVVCGRLADRLCAGRTELLLQIAAAYGMMAFVCLEAALAQEMVVAQAVWAAMGLFFAAGAAGPAGRLVSDATPPALHATSLAVLTLANNVLGLAPGPFVTGLLADHVGLPAALRLVPIAALVSAAGFWASGHLSPTNRNQRRKAAIGGNS